MPLTANILIYHPGQKIPECPALDTPEASGPPESFVKRTSGWMELPATRMESGTVRFSEYLRDPTGRMPSRFQIPNSPIQSQLFHERLPLRRIIEEEHRHCVRIFRRLSDTCSMALRQFSMLSGEFPLTFMKAPWSRLMSATVCSKIVLNTATSGFASLASF